MRKTAKKLAAAKKGGIQGNGFFTPQLLGFPADKPIMAPIPPRKTAVFLAQANSDISPMPASGSFPRKVPDDWIKRVKDILGDPCLCIAVQLGLLDFYKVVSIKFPCENVLKRVLEETKGTVNRSEWGPIDGLYQIKKKENVEIKVKVDGLFKGYENENPKLDTISLERKLITTFGTGPNSEHQSQPHYLVTFLHEAIHKLLFELNSRKTVTKEEWENELVDKILFHYFNGSYQEGGIADVVQKMEKACSPIGRCATGQPKQREGVEMAPPLTPPGPHGADYNNDNIPDSYVAVQRGWVEETEAGHNYYVGPGPKTPVLRGPPPKWIGFRLDEYKDCYLPVPPGVKLWALRYISPRDRYTAPFTRFYNSKRTMSFSPGEQVFVANTDTPQVIKSFVLFINANGGDLIAPVRAEFEDCKNAPIDELSLSTTKAERLNMDKVQKMLTGENLMQNSSAVERQMAKELNDISNNYKAEFLRISQLPEEEKDSAFLKLRDLVLPHIRKVTKSKKGLPSGWESSALILLGFPPNELLEAALLNRNQ